MANKTPIALSINGATHQLFVDARQNLLQTLRQDVGLTGAKCGCNHGVCGACTVLIDGKPSRACLALSIAMTGRDITTIEGLEEDKTAAPLLDAFVECGALQCGFCTPGMVIAAKSLLESNPNPTVDEIRHELGGNVCRCTGYVKIVDAVLALSEGV